MSKERFADLMKNERAGGDALLPGLSLGKILREVGAELKDQAAHGAHEVSAALFNGSAFVMYPKTGRDDATQAADRGLSQSDALKQNGVQAEQERGGREM